MTRIALDWILDGTPLDELFDEVAAGQYTRELTLTHFVQVMLDVASGYRPSPRAAFLRRELAPVASLSAFYRKLNRMELAIPEAVVRRTATRARQLIAASGVILDLILEEDAHCQERALVERVEVRPGQLWVMDRNFCVRSLVFRIARREASFLVRWHRLPLPFEPAGRLRKCGRCATGEVFEQPIDVADGEGCVHRLRRVVLKLDEPTRDGEAEIVLVTNLPAAVTALQCCEAYRDRWQIEGHYQTLTDLLHCEVRGLGYPRAALFAFSMATVAGNALAVVKGNLRVAHGLEVAAEVSDFALVDEVAEVYPAMMLAVPPARWPDLSRSRATTVSQLLNGLAKRVPVHRMLRSRRGPKKPRPKRSSGRRNPHVSNKKLLDRVQAAGHPPRRGRSPTTSRN